MFKLPFELFLALRYLRPKRTFVSVITLISVLGVTLGVAVLIIVISVMSGFDKELRDKILGFNAHIRIVEENSAMRDYTTIRDKIADHPDLHSVAPFVFGPLLMQTQPESGDPLSGVPFIKGIDPELEKTAGILHTNMIAGNYDVSGDGILIGWEMAQDMMLAVGDRVVIQSQAAINQMLKTRNSEDAEIHLPDEFEVRGIFDVGYYEYNSSIVVTSLETSQELYGLDNAVHGLVVMLEDPLKVNVVREDLKRTLGPRFRIILWTEEHSGILNALMVEKSVMFYILFFIMIVAAFGIMNSLITFVVQKTHDIGMLKALGTTRGQIVRLFLGQSLVVGILGVLTGFGLGMLALTYRNPFLHFMNKVANVELFPADVYGFRNLPALIMPADIAWICGSALAICILAGILPAYVASRMQPVEALRYD